MFNSPDDYVQNKHKAVSDDTSVGTYQMYSPNISYITVNEKTAMQIPAFAAGMNILCETIAGLPIQVKEKDDDGVPKTLADDYRTGLLNDAPNETMTAHDFKYAVVKNLKLYGQAVIVKHMLSKTSNIIDGLYLIPGDKLQVDSFLDATNGLTHYGQYTYMSNAGNQVFNDDDVINIVQNSQDGVIGHGLLESGQKILELALQQEKYEETLLSNGAVASGIVSLTHAVSKEAWADMKQQFNDLYSNPSNAGKTMFLPDGFAYNQISASPDNLQLTDSKKLIISDIARLLNIPETLINSDANKYNSNEQNNLQFFQYGLAPIISSIEKALNASALLEKEKDDGLFFKFNTDSIMQNTLQEKVTAYSAMMKAGMITTNEARQKLGFDPFKSKDYAQLGLGSNLFFPENGNIVIPNTGMVLNVETGEVLSPGVNKNAQDTSADKPKPNVDDSTDDSNKEEGSNNDDGS